MPEKGDLLTLGLIAGGPMTWWIAFPRIVSRLSGIVADQMTPSGLSKSAKAGREIQIGNSSSMLQPYSIVYGKMRVGANRVFVHSAGSNNKYLNLVYTWSEGPCDSIDIDGSGDIIYLDDKRVQYYDTYKGKDLVEHAFHSGTGTQAVGTIVNDASKGNASWADLYRWVCYSEFRLTYNADAWGQLPTATCVLKGRKLYDPRDSSYAWSDNGALVWLDFMTNRRYGGRIPFSLIDLDSVEEAADDLDALGWEFNGVIYQRESFGDVLKGIEDSIRATHYWSNGKYFLKVLSYDTPVATVSESDISSLPNKFDIGQGGIPETPDRVLVYFSDPDDNYTEKNVLLGLTGIVSQGIDDNPIELKFLGVADYQQAFDLGAYHLKRARASESYGPLNLKPKYGVLDPTDIVQLTHTFPGFSSKEMRVHSMGRQQAGGVVPITFIEESSDLYTGSGVTIAAHNPYQSTLPDGQTAAEEPTTLSATTGPDQSTGNDYSDAYVNFAWDNMGSFTYIHRWRYATSAKWHNTTIKVPYGEVDAPVWYSGPAGERWVKVSGDYTLTTDLTYYVEFDGTTTFKWSDDNWATTEDTLEPVTGAWQDLSNGVKIKFCATTGWTVGHGFTIKATGTGSSISHREGGLRCGELIYWNVRIDGGTDLSRSDWASADDPITTWAPLTPSMAWYYPSVTTVKQGKQLQVDWSDWEGYGERVMGAFLYEVGVSITDYTDAANNNTVNDVYLLPPVASPPAVTDQFLIISKYPFTKCFINISTKGVGTWTITWQYYNGSTWPSFSNVVDNTKGFTVAGDKSVSWSYPTDWKRYDLSAYRQGCNGYIAYAVITAFTAITTRPIARKIRIDNMTVKDYDIFCATTAPCSLIDANLVGKNVKQSPFKFPWVRKQPYDVRVRPNGWGGPGVASEEFDVDSFDDTMVTSATAPVIT